MGIGKRIKEARLSKNLTQEELAKNLGITKGSIANYENETSHPKESVMYALINTLGVDANYLFQDCVNTKKAVPLSNEEQRLISDYNSLDAHGKSVVSSVLSEEMKRMRELSNPPVSVPVSKIIPLIGNSFAAGLGNYLDEPDFHVEQFPPGFIPAGADFGIRISGNSMEPEIPDGSTVFVRSAPSIDPGRIGIFVLNGEAYCKKLIVDKTQRQIRLVSLNPAYQDIIVSESDVCRTVGQVIGKMM